MSISKCLLDTGVCLAGALVQGGFANRLADAQINGSFFVLDDTIKECMRVAEKYSRNAFVASACQQLTRKFLDRLSVTILPTPPRILSITDRKAATDILNREAITHYNLDVLLTYNPKDFADVCVSSPVRLLRDNEIADIRCGFPFSKLTESGTFYLNGQILAPATLIKGSGGAEVYVSNSGHVEVKGTVSKTKLKAQVSFGTISHFFFRYRSNGFFEARSFDSSDSEGCLLSIGGGFEVRDPQMEIPYGFILEAATVPYFLRIDSMRNVVRTGTLESIFGSPHLPKLLGQATVVPDPVQGGFWITFGG